MNREGLGEDVLDETTVILDLERFFNVDSEGCFIYALGQANIRWCGTTDRAWNGCFVSARARSEEVGAYPKAVYNPEGEYQYHWHAVIVPM